MVLTMGVFYQFFYEKNMLVTNEHHGGERYDGLLIGRERGTFQIIFLGLGKISSNNGKWLVLSI